MSPAPRPPAPAAASSTAAPTAPTAPTDPSAATAAPSRPLSRQPHRSGDLLDITVRLTARDLVLAKLLDEHRTLTTDQIAAVLFDSRSRARSRLYALRRAGWVDRFAVIRADRQPDIHWVLAPLGAKWAAGNDDRPAPSARSARERRESIASSSHLRHNDGANQVFIDLLAHTRHHPGTRLARWWSPARTASATGQRIHPDGHGVWEEHDPLNGRTVQVGFFLEFDTGTETLDMLKRKIETYRRLRTDNGPDYPLLFWLPNATREANLHRRFNGEAAHLGLTVATTTPAAVAACPDQIAGPVWKVAGNGRRRHHLADLRSTHGEPGTPYHPGTPTPQQDPLYLLGTPGLPDPG